MKSFLLASGNAHKAEEFSELFSGTMEVIPSPTSIEVDETGQTFIENAFLKAQAYFEAYGKPSLADDSGLVINALPELLGVQSARFAPDLPDYKDKCRRVIELLSDKNDRSAY